MTNCDHGIRLDRYCGDCEDGFRAHIEVSDPEAPSGAAAAYAVLVVLALVVFVVWRLTRG